MKETTTAASREREKRREKTREEHYCSIRKIFSNTTLPLSKDACCSKNYRHQQRKIVYNPEIQISLLPKIPISHLHHKFRNTETQEHFPKKMKISNIRKSLLRLIVLSLSVYSSLAFVSEDEEEEEEDAGEDSTSHRKETALILVTIFIVRIFIIREFTLTSLQK